MAEVLMAVDQVCGKPVVHVAVGYQQRVNLRQLQAVPQGVAVGVRGKSISSSPSRIAWVRVRRFFAPPCPGVGADGAGTEQGGPTLGRGSAQVAYFHSNSSFWSV